MIGRFRRPPVHRTAPSRATGGATTIRLMTGFTPSSRNSNFVSYLSSLNAHGVAGNNINQCAVVLLPDLQTPSYPILLRSSHAAIITVQFRCIVLNPYSLLQKIFAQSVCYIRHPCRFYATSSGGAFNKTAAALAYAKQVGEKLQREAFIIDQHIESLAQEKQTVNNDARVADQETKTNNLGPWKLIEKDLEKMNENIRALLSVSHPVLEAIANYYFNLKGKRIRPVLVALMSSALAIHNRRRSDPSANINLNGDTSLILPKQIQLAQIVEMIHTASLIHDDVIDEADTRRNVTSINVAFSNKMAVLAGDFLLARASISLAQLGHFEVTEIMAGVLSDLVEGEFMQMKNTATNALDFEYYLKKTFHKTASLMANGCRAAAILGGCDRSLVEAASSYGKHIGLAFQLIDDLLDFVGTKEVLGKPAVNDMKLGLTTAPALYASEEFPELRKLIARKYSEEGDVALAHSLVMKSSGLQKTRELAKHHCQLAVEALSAITDSPYKQGLIDITKIVLNRDK